MAVRAHASQGASAALASTPEAATATATAAAEAAEAASAASAASVASAASAASAPLAASAPSAVPRNASGRMSALPDDVMSVAFAGLEARELARLASTCLYLWRGSPVAVPPGAPGAAASAATGAGPVAQRTGPVAAALWARAAARGLSRVAHVGAPPPAGASSWVPHLARLEDRSQQLRLRPNADGMHHRVRVDSAGRLYTSSHRAGYSGHGVLRGHARPLAKTPGYWFDTFTPHLAPDFLPPAQMQFGSFQLVPDMQGVRVVSVACSTDHSLALGAGGEVYSWGFGQEGTLGHGEQLPRWTPCRIAALERVESIWAANSKSAAVDERGRLFTWGVASTGRPDSDDQHTSGLGHPPHPDPPWMVGGDLCVSTPWVVEALASERVVGVALGKHRMLAIVATGAVFSWGRRIGYTPRPEPEEWQSGDGGVDHLPLRLVALGATGLHFVAVAVGLAHDYALAETNELYRWTRGQGIHNNADMPLVHVKDGVKLIGTPGRSLGGVGIVDWNNGSASESDPSESESE